MARPLHVNPGNMPSNYNSTSSYVASGVIKASGPALLIGFHGYSSKGSVQFIMIFDSATVPANGTGTPVILISVPATSSFSWESGLDGKIFINGIAWSNSTTAPSNTIALADCYLSASYE